jgi:hypothetical protein
MIIHVPYGLAIQGVKAAFKKVDGREGSYLPGRGLSMNIKVDGLEELTPLH